MELKGSKSVEITGIGDKRQIAAAFCSTMAGEFLHGPPQLVYQGKTTSCLLQYKFPSEWYHPKSLVKYSEDVRVHTEYHHSLRAAIATRSQALTRASSLRPYKITNLILISALSKFYQPPTIILLLLRIRNDNPFPKNVLQLCSWIS